MALQKLTTLFVIVFLLKIRFPRGTPISTTITRRYGRNALIQYRNLERTSEQARKTEHHVKFLKVCKDYNLTPNFLGFKLYKKSLHSTDHYRTYQRILLDKEIKTQNRKLSRLRNKYRITLTNLQSIVSWLDFQCLVHRLRARDRMINKRIDDVHQRKLQRLGYNSCNKLDPRTLVKNLSDIKLTSKQINALAYGLNFALPPRKINKALFYHKFENLAQALKSKPIYQKTFDDIKKSIAHVVSSSFYDFKNWKYTLPDDDLRNTLEELIGNPNIVVTRPDKGQGVVILNKHDYIRKIREIIDDETKFTAVTEDPLQLMFSLTDRMNRFLSTLCEKKKISKADYNELHLPSAKPGVLYGLPKMHKQSIPMRPILSAIGTFNYKLAKFLVPILEPITKNIYTIDSSQDFAKFTKEFHSDHELYLASFDITSLYTNIPIDETIRIAVDQLVDENDEFINLTRSEFTRMLELSIKDNIFYFDNKLFRQIEGCPMGSPAGGTFANIFMCYNEEQWLDRCPEEFKPLVYKRYADDTFLIFKSKNHVELFRTYLNSQHPNIHFTHETEINCKLNFLDMTVTHSNGTLSIETYRKPTHSGLGTHYTSFIPHSYKTNSIHTLLHRAYTTCSSWISIDREIKFLVNFFQQNGFPSNLIFKHINHFLSKLHQPPSTTPSAPKDKLYVPLPFLGPLSYNIRNQLNKLLTPAYPQLTIKYVFTNKLTIGSLFPFKDKIPRPLQSFVIYSYKCRCSATYVGKTTCNLAKRIAEHRGVSARTGTDLPSKTYSAIREHAEAKGHPIDPDAFSVIGTARTKGALASLESIQIKLIRPNLNTQTDAEVLIL